MPYISQQKREVYEKAIDKLSKSLEVNGNLSGDLNYIVTKLLSGVVKSKGQSYAVYNNLIGILECAKMELYRRQVSSYEEQAILRNGDVF